MPKRLQLAAENVLLLSKLASIRDDLDDFLAEDGGYDEDDGFEEEVDGYEEEADGDDSEDKTAVED